MSSSKPITTPPPPLPLRAPTLRPGAPGGAREQNRRRRLSALEETALTLFLERGVESVTIDELARAAGMAKGSFYRYADDKRSLVAALLAPLSESLDAAFDRCEASVSTATDRDGLSASYLVLAGDLLAIYVAAPRAVQLYLQESRAPAVGARAPIGALERHVTERTLTLTTLAHAHGLLAKFPPELSALAVIGAVERLLLAHLREGTFNDDVRIPGLFVRMIMEGIAA